LNNERKTPYNIQINLLTEDGKEQSHPYEIDPVTLFQHSVEIDDDEISKFGSVIRSARKKAGLTQEQIG